MRFAFLFLLFAASLGPALSAQAQEIVGAAVFNPMTIEETAPTAETALGFKSSDPAPRAETKTEQLNKIYQDCANSPSYLLSARSKKTLCGCTAANMDEIMSAKDVAILNDDTDDGSYQRERMTTLAYLPCMKFPVYDVIRENCLGNDAFTEGLKKPVNTCSCVANKMSDFIEGIDAYTTEWIGQNPVEHGTMDEIIQRYFRHTSFQGFMKMSNKRCMQKHELGW